jgi:hypothetical protein
MHDKFSVSTGRIVLHVYRETVQVLVPNALAGQSCSLEAVNLRNQTSCDLREREASNGRRISCTKTSLSNTSFLNTDGASSCLCQAVDCIYLPKSMVVLSRRKVRPQAWTPRTESRLPDTIAALPVLAAGRFPGTTNVVAGRIRTPTVPPFRYLKRILATSYPRNKLRPQTRPSLRLEVSSFSHSALSQRYSLFLDWTKSSRAIILCNMLLHRRYTSDIL